MVEKNLLDTFSPEKSRIYYYEPVRFVQFFYLLSWFKLMCHFRGIIVVNIK